MFGTSPPAGGDAMLHAAQILDEPAAVEQIGIYQESLRAKSRIEAGTATLADHRALRAGDAAGQALVNSMSRLLHVIAKETVTGRGLGANAEIIDEMVAEGYIVILESAASYDVKRGGNFSARTAKLIRDTLRKRMDEHAGAGMKVAASWNRLRRRIPYEKSLLFAKLGRDPTVDELRAALEESCLQWGYEHLTPEEDALPEPERKEAAVRKLRKQGMLSALRNLDDVLQSGLSQASLDAPIGDGSGTLMDVQGGVTPDDAPRVAELADIRQALLDALSKFPERERNIVLYRFGLVGDGPVECADIAVMYGLSSERVRQIERSVRNDLKKNPTLAALMAAEIA